MTRTKNRYIKIAKFVAIVLVVKFQAVVQKTVQAFMSTVTLYPVRIVNVNFLLSPVQAEIINIFSFL